MLTKVGQLKTTLDSTGGSAGGSSGGSTGGTGGGTTSGSATATNASATTTAQDVASGTATGIVAGNFITKAINALGGWIIDYGKEGYAYEVEKETYIAELKTMMDSTWEEAEALFGGENA